MINKELLKMAKANLVKESFVPMGPQGSMPPPGAGGPPPGGMPPGMDPSMGGGGMPPGMPPMDPAMMGGMPPMDPAMMGGMPPMDPAMMGGAPPPGGAPNPAGGLTVDDVKKAVSEALAAQGGGEGGGNEVKQKPQEVIVELKDKIGRIEQTLLGIQGALNMLSGGAAGDIASATADAAAAGGGVPPGMEGAMPPGAEGAMPPGAEGVVPMDGSAPPPPAPGGMTVQASEAGRLLDIVRKLRGN